MLLDHPMIETTSIPAARRKTGRGRVPFRGTGELWDLKDKYLTWMKATRYTEATIANAHSDMVWFFKYLAQREIDRVADVTTEVLKDYHLFLEENRTYRKKSQTLAYVRRRLLGVKSFFGWLTKQMLVLYDPGEGLELPRLPQSPSQTIIKLEEAKQLLDTPDLKNPIGFRDKALLHLLYATGVRSRELLNLKVENVDLKERSVFVKRGKGGKDRLIPLPSLTAGYLHEYNLKVRPKFLRNKKGNDDGWLFMSYRGARLGRHRLNRMLERYAKKAGLTQRVTAMTLRHSIASHLLENGVDVRNIQEILGHENLSATQVYTKVTLSGLRKMYNRTHPEEKRQRHEKI